MRAGRIGLIALSVGAACASALLTGAPALAEGPRDRFDTVVLDAGHGGEDEGARGSGGLVEKDLVLDVTQRLAARLRRRGLRVVLTRERDVFIPLERRFAIANDARGDLFISIHANAAGNPEVRGVELFFLSLEASDAGAERVAARENAAFGDAATASAAAGDPLVAIIGDLLASEHLAGSNEFAGLVRARLSESDGGRFRGVKQAPFVVLTGVQMPALLVEIGFVTNREEAAELRTARARNGMVAALEGAVLEFGRRHDARHGVAAGALPAGGS